MAILNLLNQRGQEFNPTETIERYITNRSKAKSGYIGGELVNEDIVGCMDTVASLLGEKDGAKVIHFMLIFQREELNDLKTALKIAQQVTSFIGQEYQVCFAIHEDNPKNLHIHFVFNCLSYLDGYRYTGTTEENLRLGNYVAKVLSYYSDNELKLEGVFRAIGSKYSLPEE